MCCAIWHASYRLLCRKIGLNIQISGKNNNLIKFCWFDQAFLFFFCTVFPIVSVTFRKLNINHFTNLMYVKFAVI